MEQHMCAFMQRRKSPNPHVFSHSVPQCCSIRIKVQRKRNCCISATVKYILSFNVLQYKYSKYCRKHQSVNVQNADIIILKHFNYKTIISPVAAACSEPGTPLKITWKTAQKDIKCFYLSPLNNRTN